MHFPYLYQNKYAVICKNVPTAIKEYKPVNTVFALDRPCSQNWFLTSKEPFVKLWAAGGRSLVWRVTYEHPMMVLPLDFTPGV